MKVVDFRLQVLPSLDGRSPDTYHGYVTIQRDDERRVNVQLLAVEAAQLISSLSKPLEEFVLRAVDQL